MRIIRTAGAIQAAAMRLRASGKTIGFVPTMGALHAGHRSLMRAARRATDVVVVSVFVNPLQFGPPEYSRRYPRDLEADLRVCREEGVDWLFVPSPTEMYPDGFQTFVEVERLSRPLCGEARPGHFLGVATVVLKLFCLIQPHEAFFGRKDYQQATIIKRMIRDLQMPLRIIVCPTVREPDGLACSSRNRSLSPAERRTAPALYAALREGERLIVEGERAATRIVGAVRRRLAAARPPVRIEYVAIVAPETLQPVARVIGSVVLLAAARIGTTRLIDNLVVKSPTPRTSRSGSR